MSPVTQSIILFGVRSPLTVEYEETCHRLGIAISLAVSVNGTPRLLSDCPVVDVDHVRNKDITEPFLSCAFVPKRRAELIQMAMELGLELAEALIDPTAVVAASSRVGRGTFINALSAVGGASIIGDGVLMNRCSSIGHHVALGDYVSLGPGATLAGNIHVGAGAVIGAGATVLPDLRIGAGAIVAGGSVVRRDVPENTLVAGNPAAERRFDPSRSSLYVENGE